MLSRVSQKVLFFAIAMLSTGSALLVAALGDSRNARNGIQLITFILFIALLSKLSLRGTKIPRILLGIATIGVLCGALVRHSDVDLQSGAFGISLLSSDKLTAKTAIFRDNTRRVAGPNYSNRIGLINETVASENEAQTLLKQRKNLGGVVWGKERWITVSVRPREPIPLSSRSDTSIAHAKLEELGIPDLFIISQIPRFGLSHALDSATFEFVGRLLRSLHDYPGVLSNGEEPLDLETNLKRAGSIRTRWSSIGHLAAPRWMLGTLYLMRAISGPELSTGDARCADQSFEAARKALRSGSNPALLAAINNNQAILHLIAMKPGENRERLIKRTRMALKSAIRLQARSRYVPLEDTFWDPITANLEALEKLDQPSVKRPKKPSRRASDETLEENGPR